MSPTPATASSCELVTPSPWRKVTLTRRDLLIAVLLALLGMASRIPLIVRGGTLLDNDEAVVGVMAQDIAEGSRYPIFFYGQRYMGALEAYVIAALTPVISDPLIRLRSGPALFFGALIAVQYLMLSRWFGRRCGFVGIATLIAGSPMFAQWSIAARGGYVEIFLIGSLFWWAYGEWFVDRDSVTTRSKATLGFLFGFGLWVNPMIVTFVAPVVLHVLLNVPLFQLRQSNLLPKIFGQPFPIGTSLTKADSNSWWRLPILLLLLVLMLNCIVNVAVRPEGVRYSLFLDLVPPWIGGTLLALTIMWCGMRLNQQVDLRSRFRAGLNRAAPFVFGSLLGAGPMVFYVVHRIVTNQSLDESLPMGLRPLWLVQETLRFTWHGLPVLFGANPEYFVKWTYDGRHAETYPLSEIVTSALLGSNWIVCLSIIGLISSVAIVVHRELKTALSLLPRSYSPEFVLTAATFGFIAFYLLCGAVTHFPSIRYLLLLWTSLPGLFAIGATSFTRNAESNVTHIFARQKLGSLCWIVTIICWGFGQGCLWKTIDPSHPLDPVAKALNTFPSTRLAAADFDACLLSYLTQQELKVIEFHPLWRRFKHYIAEDISEGTTSYVMLAIDSDFTRPWDWPGSSEPSTCRYQLLRRQLHAHVAANPGQLIARHALPNGYELWSLKQPMPEIPISEIPDTIPRELTWNQSL